MVWKSVLSRLGLARRRAPGPRGKVSRKARLCLEALEDRQLPSTGPLLVFHNIQTDAAGKLLPWYSADPGVAYDHVLGLVWNYWKSLPVDDQGRPAYLTIRDVGFGAVPTQPGIGGDQFAMAIDSWLHYYQYTGDPAVLQNAADIANYYLAHSLAPAGYAYGNLPFPCNTGGGPLVYDGDLVAGTGVLQPDKAGSFGAALVSLYQVTGNPAYLRAAVNIADTLAATVNFNPGPDASPWPFRVVAQTGLQPSVPGVFTAYTTNYGPTLALFQSLVALNQGNVAGYNQTFAFVLGWMQNPLRTNAWGPFFEDIPGYSDTEMNADTWAYYLLRNPSWDANWRQDVRGILDWVQSAGGFADPGWGGIDWAGYGVTPIDEQTAYRNPGNSHTARHASTELTYDALAGDFGNAAGAVRQLSWSTYMVRDDGANDYPNDAIWLTDGYGDYVRHYLRALAADPALAPANQDHLLGTTSSVTAIHYQPGAITYATADADAQDVLRVTFAPGQVTAGGVALPRLQSLADLQGQEGYTFDAPGDAPGVLRIHHRQSGSVAITGMVTAAAAPSNLSATPASAREIDLAWTGDASGAVRYVIDRATDSGFTQNLVTQETFATGFADTAGLLPATTYFYRVRAAGAGGPSANSDPVSAQTPASGLPAGFSDADFGSPHFAGSAGFDGTTWTIRGGGADMFDDVQQFHFAYVTVSGDQAVTAEVTGVANTDPWAGAGALVRDGTDPGAAFANVFVTPGVGVAFQWRPSAGAACGSVTVPGVSAPRWVRLVRQGDTVSAFSSADDVTWSPVGAPVAVAFTGGSYLAGLAVTAHNDAALNTSTFTNVTVAPPGPAAAAAVNQFADPGFESVGVGGGSPASFAYDPVGSPWSFGATAGVAGNGSAFTAGNPDAPEGAQVAFLQMAGTISQVVTFRAGSYAVTFLAAQRGGPGQASSQTFAVEVDGQVVGTFTPAGAAYAGFTTGGFTAAAGAHAVTFVGLDPDGGDNTALIDQVGLVAL